MYLLKIDTRSHPFYNEPMEKLEYIVPCHFGLEAVLKKEIMELGYEIVSVCGRYAGDLPCQYFPAQCPEGVG